MQTQTLSSSVNLLRVASNLHQLEINLAQEYFLRASKTKEVDTRVKLRMGYAMVTAPFTTARVEYIQESG